MAEPLTMSRAGISRLVRFALLALASLPAAALSADKSSSRPGVISIPSGPGSVSGLGESFTPNLNTGSARESIPLELPQGTAGLTPTLALAYDTGAGNGPLGIGWSLGVSTIQLQTEKGLPRYDGQDVLLLDGAELVPLGAGVYRLKNEGRFVRVRRGTEHFEVDAPDGSTMVYGLSPTARVVGRVRGVSVVFAWALERVVDRFGNEIHYSYRKDRGQVYLESIEYNARPGAAQSRVALEYEPRPDALPDYRARFGVVTGLRLARVRTYALGQPVRRYDLAYDEENGLSLLASVTSFGRDGTTALPPVRFEYSRLDGAATPVAMNEVPDAIPGPGTGDDELVDVDGDGCPDLLHAESGEHWFALNLGGRTFGPRMDMPWSPSVGLSARGVEVGDFDGDGIADLIARLGLTTPEWHVFPNRGAGRWEAGLVMSRNPTFGPEDPNARVMDIDHDKLADLVRTTADGFELWRNAGDGSWEGPWLAPLPPSGEGLRFEDPHLKLADMNGDRLLDLVYVLDGSVTYWPGMGWGDYGAPVEIANSPAPGSLAEPELQLADVNGDGLTDLLWVNVDRVEYWPLKPGDAFGESIRVGGTPYRDPAYTVIRLADMNGNGSTDVVWSTPAGAPDARLVYLDLLGEVRPNLLVAVGNGLGKRLELQYATSGSLFQAARDRGAPWARRVPFSVQVLAESRLLDGLGHSHTASYDYRDGWYAQETREFRGFARVTQTEAGDVQEATPVRIHAFDLGASAEVRKGLPLSVETRTEQGLLLLRETFAYDVRVHATGIDGTLLRSAERRRHEIEHWEGTSSPAVTREEWEHDDYGNVLVHSEWGIVVGDDVRAGGDERIATSTYANDTAAWLLGRVTRTTVTDAAGTVFSDQCTYYDGESFVGLPLGQLGSAGAITRSEAWVEGTRWAQVDRVERDAYGLVVARLDPLGVRHEVDYDRETHRFPVAERTRLDDGRVLSLGADYDAVLGVLRVYRDARGAETRFTWDALGRLTGIVRPGDTEAKPTTSFEYRYGNPRSEIVSWSRVRVGADERIEKHAWYDGLGRQLGSVEEAEDGKTLVSGAKEYGIQGRVIREYEPSFSSGYDLPPPAGLSTAHFYDALGRTIRTDLPDGSSSELRYRPFLVERWDAEDLDPSSPHHETPRLERSTALGVIEVAERLGPKTIATTFERDPLGRIQSATDAVGLTATWTRDGLGRVVSRLHPDAGRTDFVYDDAGSLLRQVDARGAAVDLAYDALGRPTLETLTGADGGEESRVRYHYDDPSPLFPGDVATGELAWVEDSAGEEHYRRDARGRLVESVRKLSGKSYRILHAYDDLDRMSEVTYPSGRTIELRYNPRSLLEAVPGVIRSIEYGPNGLATARRNENGTHSTASYDAMDRVTGIGTVASGRTVQSLAYRYDRVGNVTAIEDALRSSGPLAAGRAYAYDDLYRLTAGAGADRSFSYAFDDSGDFTSRDGRAHVLGRAHQVASVDGKSYEYDEAGNAVVRPGSRLSYDARGRLARVEIDDGTAVTYRYDYTGQRIVRESTGPRGTHRTVYVDRLSEERDGELVDYVFAGDVRVARLGGGPPTPVVVAGVMSALPLGLGGSALLLVAMGLVAASLGRVRIRRHARALTALGTACALLGAPTMGCGGGTDSGPSLSADAIVYHGDHLGGVALQTDGAGRVAAETAYDPYGAALAASSEPYGFTGKEYEPDTGLYDYGARAYDPALGRFLSPDPAVLADPSLGVDDPQQLNPYAYARNSPAAYVDPDGRLGHIALGALVGAIAGAAIYSVKAASTGQFSARGLIGAAAGGAVTGALAAATMGASLAVTAAAGGTMTAASVGVALYGTATAGVAGGLVDRAVSTGSYGQTFEPKAVARDAAYGAAGYLGGTVVGKLATQVAPYVKAGVARAGQGLKQVWRSAAGGAANGQTTVIGKLKVLQNLRAGESTLLERLPDRGSPRANWKQNSGVLRQEMGKGKPIRDASVTPDGTLRDNTGFLRAERNLKETHGWQYDPSTQLWSPP